MPDNHNFSSAGKFRDSSFGPISIGTLPEIVAAFNQEDDSSRRRVSVLKNINPFGFSLFKHRMVAKDQVRLVQRNGIPELAAYSGNYQRRKKVWTLWKPWTWFRIFRDDSSTIKFYKIAEINDRSHIGYGDRHLVSVNPGNCAKVEIDGLPVLLGEGAHVIKTNNFLYLEKKN